MDMGLDAGWKVGWWASDTRARHLAENGIQLSPHSTGGRGGSQPCCTAQQPSCLLRPAALAPAAPNVLRALCCRVRAEAERKAVNSTIQGSAAGVALSI